MATPAAAPPALAARTHGEIAFELFVAGVMNLVWVAVLAALVLLEKAAPAGPLIGRLAGVGLCGWGIWLALWRG